MSKLVKIKIINKNNNKIITTSVINIKKANLIKLGYRDLLHWLEDPTHIYIGRNMSFYVPGAVKSKWCNPYSVKKYGLDECIRLYKEYIINQPELMNCLDELNGKILGCWCDDKCHGHVLIDLLKSNII
jgi:hypothetical protein